MLKINVSEGKPNRFEQAANILGVVGTSRGRWLLMLSSLDGEGEVCEELYAALEADIAAVDDWVAKDWLRAYGVGRRAEKLRADGEPAKSTRCLWSERQITKFMNVSIEAFLANIPAVSEAEMVQALNRNKVWEHKKSGNRYGVVAITNTAATKEGFPVMVVYTRGGSVWSRPISEFFEKFKVATRPSEEGVASNKPSEVARLRFAIVDHVAPDSAVLNATLRNIGDPFSTMDSNAASKEEARRRLQEGLSPKIDPLPDAPRMSEEFRKEMSRWIAESSNIVDHPLQEVFDAVIAQVTTGKGQRHGGGEQPFYEQPWFTTTQQVGIGFPLGQAMKKLGESSSKPDAESFETELLGAIAYAAMAYLANKKLAGKS